TYDYVASPAYALEATGGSASLNGVTGLTLNGSNLLVRVRNGLDVSGDTSIPSSVQTPNGPVTLDFSGLGSGTTNVTDIEGHLTLAVDGFGSLDGDFGFQSYKDQSGGQQIAIGARNLSVVLGTSTTNLTLSNASFGLVIEPGITTVTETDISNGTTASISLAHPANKGTVVVVPSIPPGGAATPPAGAVTAAGSVVATPAVMKPYIVVGATLEINAGQTDQEFVTVSAVTATTFTATFAQTHTANFTIDHATTTSASAITTAGSVVVTPAVMNPYIVVGPNLVINAAKTDQEFVTVSAVTATTFTATFAQPHTANFTISDTVTLTGGADYVLGTAANGNTTVNFTTGHIPANGTALAITYTFAGGPATYALEAKG